ELARVFRRSRELLEQAGCTSFGSLISETLRLWDREPAVLARLRERFRFVLVDEFQDSNYAQMELLKRLVAPPCDITAVGDDDQAIYRFRGASHGAFQMFHRAFPGHRTVYLNRNYRSSRRILRASQTVIVKNEGRYDLKPPLRTENSDGARVHLVESPDDRSEAGWVADEVERLAQRGARLGDMAVLYRGHLHREGLVSEFRRREIPFDIRGLSILRTAMVRDLVSFLRLIQSPHHNVSLTRVLLAPRWKFPEELALDACRRASQARSSLYTAIRATRQTLFAADLRRTGWEELESFLGRLREAAWMAPVTVLFDRLIEGLGLTHLVQGGRGRDRDSVMAFRKFLEAWEQKNETGSSRPPEDESNGLRTALDEFMEYFQYFIEAGGQVEAPEPPQGSNSVQMMTVHAAKGLEFPIVFVLSVARQRFPSTERRPVIEFPDALRKGPPAPRGIHLQEERRLFYVAMTRARERLYVSTYGKSGRKQPVFVEDLLSDHVVEAQDIERIKAAAVEGQSTAVRSAASQTGAGSRTGAVAHPNSGFGRVPTSKRNPNENGQGNLFPDEQDTAAWLHPDLEKWARRPVGGAEEPGRLPVLSATAIETYQTCPLRFKFQHLLKIQTAPQAQLTFGAVMHESVRHYFRLRQEGAPRFEDVERFYLHAWKDAGFQDNDHAEQAKRTGLDQLREFVTLHNALPSPQQAISEQGFSFEVHGVRVQGRIDQVQTLVPEGVAEDGAPPARNDSRSRDVFLLQEARLDQPAPPSAPAEGSEVELIDFKTGRPKSQKDADTSLQLSVYALAAERALGLRPSRLTFYNLTNNQAVSTIRTEKDLDDVVREIREVAGAVREGRFEPSPGYACRRCEYAAICPAQEER
ncbi:MAG TPA: ATP-dependent DNA helicase, partial [Terriglobia bacterium]